MTNSNTFIDNIFSNFVDPDLISGNLTAAISDHLHQFATIPNMFGNVSGNKSSIYERGWLKFDQEHFILDYILIMKMQPTDKEKIATSYPLSTFLKASGINSVPYRILFPLENRISKQLADLFNLSFMTGVFPLVLKLQK